MFDASEKTITFDAALDFDIQRLKLITNVTDGIIIYNFAAPAKGGTAAGDVLTLEYDTTTMADADKIQIIYDVEEHNADNPLAVQVAGNESGESLGNLQSSAVAVGDGTTLDVTGLDFVAVDVRGITSAVVTFQGSINNTDFSDLLANTIGTMVWSATTIANGMYIIPVSGLKYLKARISSYSSGTITIAAYKHKGMGPGLGLYYKVNPEKNIDVNNGLARVQTKYTYNPAGAPLRGTTLYASGSAAFLIKNSPGALFSVMANHINATETYFQLFDKASAPATADVPILSIPLAQYEKLKLTQQDLLDLGLIFFTGISGGFSSTKATFTALGTATDCHAVWRYL